MFSFDGERHRAEYESAQREREWIATLRRQEEAEAKRVRQESEREQAKAERERRQALRRQEQAQIEIRRQQLQAYAKAYYDHSILPPIVSEMAQLLQQKRGPEDPHFSQRDGEDFGVTLKPADTDFFIRKDYEGKSDKVWHDIALSHDLRNSNHDNFGAYAMTLRDRQDFYYDHKWINIITRPNGTVRIEGGMWGKTTLKPKKQTKERIERALEKAWNCPKTIKRAIYYTPPHYSSSGSMPNTKEWRDYQRWRRGPYGHKPDMS